MRTVSPISTIEAVNLTLAIMTWMFPDLPIVQKSIVSGILVGIVILSRIRPNIKLQISGDRYIVLVISVIVIGIIEMWGSYLIALMFGASVSENSTPLSITLMGLTFGVVYGLPIGLLSFLWEGSYERRFLQPTAIGNLIFLITIAVLIFPVGFYISGVYDIELYKQLGIIAGGLLGPSYWLIISAADFGICFLYAILIYVINLPFELVGRAFSKAWKS